VGTACEQGTPPVVDGTAGRRAVSKQPYRRPLQRDSVRNGGVRALDFAAGA